MVCELLYALDFLVTIEMFGLYGGCFVVGGLVCCFGVWVLLIRFVVVGCGVVICLV